MLKTKLFLLFILVFYQGQINYLKAADTSIGSFRKLSGKVWITTFKNGEEKVKEAKLNGEIYEKDLVKTEKDSSALVIFIDGSSMDIKESSECRMSEFKIKKGGSVFSSLFDLAAGKVRLYLNKKIKGKRDAKVRTTSTVMGIRGTDVVIDSSNKQTTIACVSCSQGKLPTIAERSNPNKRVRVGMNQMQTFGGGQFKKNKINKRIKNIISSSISNSSHKYAAAKVRRRNVKITPRVVVESISSDKEKKKSDKKDNDKTNSLLLEGYSESKEKARNEAEKQELKKLFKEQKVEVRIWVE